MALDSVVTGLVNNTAMKLLGRRALLPPRMSAKSNEQHENFYVFTGNDPSPLDALYSEVIHRPLGVGFS